MTINDNKFKGTGVHEDEKPKNAKSDQKIPSCSAILVRRALRATHPIDCSPCNIQVDRSQAPMLFQLGLEHADQRLFHTFIHLSMDRSIME